MARRGQVGVIEQSGKWYVVRFWKYPPGQDRIHASEKICPISGEGFLTKGERRRKANEIVAASGVNNPQEFIAETVSVTFRRQAAWFLNHAMNRKRNPVKPATSQTWENCLDKWLNPNLGDLPLASVNNATVKGLVAKMNEAGLSPKSVSNYVGLVKLVVASAVDDNGEQLHMRRWNHEFIDLPLVEAQHQPTFTTDVMSKIIEKADGEFKVLFSLLAGTGLRAGEALGLELKHLSSDCSTITVEQSCWEGDIQTPKTKNAYRQIDVCPKLAELLKAFVKDRQAGLLFVNTIGKPLSQTNVLRRSLHPILTELGAPKAGFHAMRRFRTTWLRKQRAPEDLIKFWLGHAKLSVTDGYSKLADDEEFRRQVAAQVGTGFDVPAFESVLIPMRPRKTQRRVVSVAA
ncbi:MAG TPA: site-specific integrase [Nitrospira sp.]|nr:site-specific integrase [Nitrospira sp.]